MKDNLKRLKSHSDKLIKESSKERKKELELLREQMERDYWIDYQDKIDRMPDGSDEQGWDDDGFEREEHAD